MSRSLGAKPSLLERDVTKQVCDYVRAKGWDPIRLHAGTMKAKNCFIRLGKKGRPDWLMAHPQIPPFYVEMKRENGVLSDMQAVEIAGLIRLGYKVAVPYTIDEFVAWYRREIETRI